MKRERLTVKMLYEIAVEARKAVEAKADEPKTNLCDKVSQYIQEKHGFPILKYEISALTEDLLASNPHFVNEYNGRFIIDTQLEYFGYLGLDEEFVKKYVYTKEEYEQKVPQAPTLEMLSGCVE